MREIYLDNSATTKPYKEVVDIMTKIYTEDYGNASSLHIKGIEAERYIEGARETLAECINAKSNEIIFTSGGTESNNLAIRGFLNAHKHSGKHVITTKIEHPSVLEVFKYLEEEGYTVDYLDVDKNGVINLEQLKNCINDSTSLISIMQVNNETGAIQPIKRAVEIKNSINKKAVFHVDAIQSFGKFKIDVKRLGIDLMSISAHKVKGPKGIGALYKKDSIRIKPLLLGGGQEFGFRSGTTNVPSIAGFGTACEIGAKKIDESFDKIKMLKKFFIEELEKRISGEFQVNSTDDGLPYILNISFENVKSEVLLHHLESKGIYVSAGSACSSKKNTKSYVLSAMGIKPKLIDGAIRFSFCYDNNKEEIIEVAEEIAKILPIISYGR